MAVRSVNRREIPRVLGMRDATARDHEASLRAAGALRTVFGNAGYSPIDTPMLEETELFVRKSGGELTSRLYSFTDPGGHKVSLRPEFTSSVIRYFVQDRASFSLPVRWQYSGPVFRYEKGSNGSYRQFTQMGAELIGSAGTEPDGEILSLAFEGLQELGVRGHQLRIGHLGLLNELLDGYGLSEPAKLFIVGNVQELKMGRVDVAGLKVRAEEVGLLSAGLDLGAEAVLAGLSEEAAQGFIQGALKGSMPSPVGRRTPDQIVGRLLRKLRYVDDPASFEAAVELVGSLARLEGPPTAVLEDAREIATRGRTDVRSFDEVAGLLEALALAKISSDQVTLDLGLARGISYYSGVIFELMYASEGRTVSLGGGGRYDGLVKALGADEDVPALGFACNLDRVVELSGGS